MGLKTVFFDFGGTIDLYPEIRENALVAVGRIMTMLDEIGIEVSGDYPVSEFYTKLVSGMTAYKGWKKTSLEESPSLQVWREYLIPDHREKDRLNAGTAEDLTYLMENGRYTRSPRPEMKDVMEELMSTRLNFGIISNILSLTQVPRNLVDYGLDKYFSEIILSSEFGMVKPAASIFHHAADRYGCRPDECIYVGNSPSNDIGGAKNAGYMAAIQIEYNDDPEDMTGSSPVPDHYITTMRDLPPIIRSYM